MFPILSRKRSLSLVFALYGKNIYFVSLNGNESSFEEMTKVEGA